MSSNEARFPSITRAWLIFLLGWRESSESDHASPLGVIHGEVSDPLQFVLAILILVCLKERLEDLLQFVGCRLGKPSAQ